VPARQRVVQDQCGGCSSQHGGYYSVNLPDDSWGEYFNDADCLAVAVGNWRMTMTRLRWNIFNGCVIFLVIFIMGTSVVMAFLIYNRL
jgi:hypothetical protein